MAAFDTTRPFAPVTAVGGFTKRFMTVFSAIAAWNDTRATRKALRQLNARQLSDIGLISSDIDLFVAKYR